MGTKTRCHICEIRPADYVAEFTVREINPDRLKHGRYPICLQCVADIRCAVLIGGNRWVREESLAPIGR